MRTWIFQGNPKIYDVVRAVRSLQEDTWLVRQHRDDIHAGDRVYLWESGQAAGIVAVAQVLDEPSERDLPDESRSFVRDTKKLGGVQARVRIRVSELVEPRLSKSAVSGHPKLAELAILKAPQGTNFAVTPDQAEVLEDLLRKR